MGRVALERMRIGVLGPGGVGGLLAALLAREGDSVVLLHDSAPHQIRVESERFSDFSAEVETAPRLLQPVKAVLVTVKATQLANALKRVPPASLHDAVVVPFLNGIDHVELLRSLYPPASVVPATVRIETTKVAAGWIRHTSPFASVEMGPRGERIANHLRAAGLDVRIREDELAMLWDKMAVLAPLASLTTHERGTVGAVRARRREDLQALMREFSVIAAAEGVTIDPDKNLRFADMAPEAMETSMQRDQAAGRPLELDALGGAVLRRAAKAGIETPVTRRIVQELQARVVSTSA